MLRFEYIERGRRSANRFGLRVAAARSTVAWIVTASRWNRLPVVSRARTDSLAEPATATLLLLGCLALAFKLKSLVTFPDCPQHPRLPTEWKAITDDSAV